MAEPPKPPAPPPPPAGDGTPDAGNPAGAHPPDVEPKPGRMSEQDREAGAPKPPRRKAAPKASAPGKPPSPRRAARPKPVAPKRPRATAPNAAAPTRPAPVDTAATDPATRRRGRWLPALAGFGAMAVALLTLRGSSRRRKAARAEENPDEPADR